MAKNNVTAMPNGETTTKSKTTRKKSALRTEIVAVAKKLDLPASYVSRKVRARTKEIDAATKRFKEEQMAAISGHVEEIIAESFRTAATTTTGAEA